MADYPPIHPGEILRTEFLEPIGITPYRLAKDLGVPLTRIAAVVDGWRAISADTGLRLSRYFGMSESFWVNLQAHYEVQKSKDALGRRLDREVRPRAA